MILMMYMPNEKEVKTDAEDKDEGPLYRAFGTKAKQTEKGWIWQTIKYIRHQLTLPINKRNGYQDKYYKPGIMQPELYTEKSTQIKCTTHSRLQS